MSDNVKSVIAGQSLEKTTPGALIVNAILKMRNAGIHSLLVFEGDKFVGIITSTDIETKKYGSNDLVEKIMTKAYRVKFVGLDDTFENCKKIMKKYKIHHLVVKDGKKVVAVVSNTDLVLAQNESLAQASEIAGEMYAS